MHNGSPCMDSTCTTKTVKTEDVYSFSTAIVGTMTTSCGNQMSSKNFSCR